METRANYVLIGAFALAGFLGILAFFLWFASIQFDRQFAYYDIDFPTVSGLSDASDVRFAGLPVGQVVNVRLSPDNNGLVRVRVEVEAATPVRTDSVATIESQGVTGVSFVGISAGSPDAPLLATASRADVPKIEAGQSVLQSLSQNAPEILSETLEVVRELRNLIGGENQQRVQNILENVEQSSASFATALADFSEVTGTVSKFAQEIDRFNTLLDSLSADASGVLEAARTSLVSIDELSEDARNLMGAGTDAVTQLDTTMQSADRYIVEELGPATEQLRQSVEEIERRITALGESADALVTTYAETGQIASDRLTEARETLAATDALIAQVGETVGSVDSAARRFDAMMEGSAGPLIEELRVATAEATDVLRVIGETANTDLPAIMAEIREATEAASGVVKTVGEDLSTASGQIDGLARSASETLDGARETFANANVTLEAINGALETGDRALTAAEKAFAGADRVMNEDISGIVERLRLTLDELESAVGAVADEIPSVTEELRAASRSAQAAFAQIEGAVDETAPAVRAFATNALPQYGRLATETRTLIDNLDALVEQIRRDPSRFFLDPRAPEYRR